LLSILEAHVNIQKREKEGKNKKMKKLNNIYIYISGDNMKNT
jgi:hypothetical protein